MLIDCRCEADPATGPFSKRCKTCHPLVIETADTNTGDGETDDSSESEQTELSHFDHTSDDDWWE